MVRVARRHAAPEPVWLGAGGAAGAIGGGANFLLVVDQFEEIFRYDEAGAVESEAANDFVAMLSEASTSCQLTGCSSGPLRCGVPWLSPKAVIGLESNA